MKNFITIGLICMLLAAVSSCVQAEHVKKVTFRVDLNNYDSFNEVGIRGQFTSPPWQVTVPMSDPDNDGFFEAIIEQKTAQSSAEFKFVIDNDQFELECQPNRSIRYTYQPEVILYSAVFDNANGTQESH